MHPTYSYASASGSFARECMVHQNRIGPVQFSVFEISSSVTVQDWRFGQAREVNS